MNEYFEGRRKRRIVRLVTVVCILLILAVGGYTAVRYFTIENIVVDGSSHYTQQEIIDMVIQKPEDRISLVLSLKYRNKSITDIAFIQSIEVTVTAHDSIRIQVYEKAVAGYIEYLGQYMYFDKDGIMVEASNVITTGLPEITGLSFQSVVLNEPLPVENMDVFGDILDITNLLQKYGLEVDKIYFNKDLEITLYMGNVRAQLGDGSLLTEKIMKLRDLNEHLEGLSGVLHLENYTSSSSTISFTKDPEN